MTSSGGIGASSKPLAVGAFGLIPGRRSLSGSAIGGIAETQEMLDFCGRHNISADVEVIPTGGQQSLGADGQVQGRSGTLVFPRPV